LRTVASGEIRPALSLILAGGDQPAAERQVSEFLRITASRGIDLTHLIIAESAGRILWALLPVETRGRTLQVLSPNHLIGGDLDAAGRLIEEVCAIYTRRGSQLVQVLVDPAAADVRGLYLRHHFMELARLIYLQAPVRPGKPAPQLPPELYFERYSSAAHDLFAAAIRDSYRHSLDCPALSGLRDIDDVIQGHRAAGGPSSDRAFDGRLWRVLLRRQPAPLPPVPCGVLLLCQVDSNEAMELVYLGLSPEMRGRGLGDLLLHQAFSDAAAEASRRLTLAVDSRNHPALALYFRHGFAKVAEKMAILRDLRKTGPSEG
jgi:ribosomal protein S18 acetylase RimI-like enzyme